MTNFIKISNEDVQFKSAVVSLHNILGYLEDETKNSEKWYIYNDLKFKLAEALNQFEKLVEDERE